MSAVVRKWVTVDKNKLEYTSEGRPVCPKCGDSLKTVKSLSQHLYKRSQMCLEKEQERRRNGNGASGGGGSGGAAAARDDDDDDDEDDDDDNENEEKSEESETETESVEQTAEKAVVAEKKQVKAVVAKKAPVKAVVGAEKKQMMKAKAKAVVGAEKKQAKAAKQEDDDDEIIKFVRTISELDAERAELKKAHEQQLKQIEEKRKFHMISFGEHLCEEKNSSQKPKKLKTEE